MDGLWNVNIHYDARLAACVPAAAAAVLDVGCGDGFLAARLARRVPLVVAVDSDAPVLSRARARFPDAPVTWCHGDVLTHPLEPGSFDAVLSNAALHHLPDARAALGRLSQLVRPGGTLAIVGFARKEWRELPWAVTAFVSRGVAIRLHGKWEHTAPLAWPPPDTFRQLRQAARDILPGARIRRLLLGRYLLTWTRPPVGSQPSVPLGLARTCEPIFRDRPGLAFPAVRSFVSQVRASQPEDRDGNLVGRNDLAAQGRQVFANLGRALAAAGARPDQVAKITIYVVRHRPEFLPVIEQARQALFGERKPADTIVGVAALSQPGYLIEVDAFAAT